MASSKTSAFHFKASKNSCTKPLGLNNLETATSTINTSYKNLNYMMNCCKFKLKILLYLA